MQTWHTAYEVCLRNPRIIARSLDPRFAQENPRMVRIRTLRILYIHTSYIHTCTHIHNESTKVQNPRRNSTAALCIYCACAYIRVPR